MSGLASGQGSRFMCLGWFRLSLQLHLSLAHDCCTGSSRSHQSSKGSQKLPGGRGFSFQLRNATNAPAVISGIRMLQHLLDATARGIYWGFIAARVPDLHCCPCVVSPFLSLDVVDGMIAASGVNGEFFPNPSSSRVCGT